MPHVYDLAYGQKVMTDEPSWMRVLDGEVALMRGEREELKAHPGDIVALGGQVSGIRSLYGAKPTGDAQIEIWPDSEFRQLAAADAMALEQDIVMTMYRLLLEIDAKVAALTPPVKVVIKTPGFAGKLAATFGLGGPKATIDVSSGLTGSPTFGGLDAGALGELAGLGKAKALDTHQPLVLAGETPTDVFLVVKGGAAVLQGDEEAGIPLRAVEAGHVVGFMEQLQGGPQPYNVVATAPLEAIVFKGSKLVDVYHHADEVGRALRLGVMRSLAAQLTVSQEMIDAKKRAFAEENDRQRSTPPPSPRHVGPPTESLSDAIKTGGKRFY